MKIPLISKKTDIYNIYCDESSVNNPKAKFMLIGALFIKRGKVPEIKQKVKELQKKYSIRGELKWTKASSLSLSFYKELFNFLFSLSDSVFSYRCIIVDKSRVDYEKYHDKDKDLAFYKFYYHLFKNKLSLDNKYYIFLDFKPSKNKDAVRRLGDFLSFTKTVGDIRHIQAYRSKDNVFIQIADVLTGAVGFNKNKIGKSVSKQQLAKVIASSIRKDNLDFCSPLSEKKFNLFCIILDKGKENS